MIQLLSHDRLAEVVGDELRRMRIAAGMSLQDVADAMDSYRPIIGRAELGYHVPEIQAIETHAIVCGGDPAVIWRAVDRAMGWTDEQLGYQRRVSARATRT